MGGESQLDLNSGLSDSEVIVMNMDWNQLRFKTRLYHLLAVCPWARCLTSLCLF